jgi:proteasome lid subunit RPN8/RPN11
MALTDPNFESWGVEESPISIDYSLVVIEEIRHEVAQGLQRFSRGGLEVGGVLYGARDGRKVRIQAMRPIECEHKLGPSFVLSEADRAALEQQLREEAGDPGLAGLICVGWYVSHTRGEIALTEADREIFSSFFPNPWQVTLVVRPGRAGSMRAAFFVWEADGSVQADRSYKEFDFPDRLAGVLDRPRGGPRGETLRLGYRSAGAPIPIPTRHDPAPGAPAPPAGLFETSHYMPAPLPQRRRWPWVAGIAAAVLAAVGLLGSRYWFAPETPEPLALAVLEQAGQLQVQWNPVARPIQKAVRGYLEFVDGGESSTIALSRPELESGKYQYVRKSGDVEVRLVAENADNQLVSERSHFVGRPPVVPQNEELRALEAQKAELEAEVERLRRENASQAARIQQLNTMIRVLQSRLGIAQ